MPLTSRSAADTAPGEKNPPASHAADDRTAVQELPFIFKLAGSEPVGKKWEGLVAYRLPDDPGPAIHYATGIEIEEEWIRFEATIDNRNHGVHVFGKIDMMIHLAGGEPLQAQGEIISISSGSQEGYTALQVRFRNMTFEAHQRIEAFLTS
jgi:hypothetical protein